MVILIWMAIFSKTTNVWPLLCLSSMCYNCIYHIIYRIYNFSYTNTTSLFQVDAVTGQELTYNQLQTKIVRTASGLARMGICKGDVVTLFMPNCLEFPVVFLAVTALGAVASTVNSAYTAGMTPEGPQLWCCKPSLNYLAKALTHIIIFIYLQTSNINRTLVGNKIVDHSDVVGASPGCAAPTTSSFSTYGSSSLSGWN